ncbi:MAG: hypothetical protein AAFV49_18095 [Pseudomonadota bacterium]
MRAGDAAGGQASVGHGGATTPEPLGGPAATLAEGHQGVAAEEPLPSTAPSAAHEAGMEPTGGHAREPATRAVETEATATGAASADACGGDGGSGKAEEHAVAPDLLGVLSPVGRATLALLMQSSCRGTAPPASSEWELATARLLGPALCPATLNSISDHLTDRVRDGEDAGTPTGEAGAENG